MGFRWDDLIRGATAALPGGMNIGITGMASAQRRIDEKKARQDRLAAQSFNQMVTNRNFDYGRKRDELADTRYDQSYQDEKFRAQTGDAENLGFKLLDYQNKLADNARMAKLTDAQAANYRETANPTKASLMKDYVQLKATNPDDPRLPDMEKFLYPQATAKNSQIRLHDAASKLALKQATRKDQSTMFQDQVDWDAYDQHYQNLLEQLAPSFGVDLNQLQSGTGDDMQVTSPDSSGVPSIIRQAISPRNQSQSPALPMGSAAPLGSQLRGSGLGDIANQRALSEGRRRLMVLRQSGKTIGELLDDFQKNPDAYRKYNITEDDIFNSFNDSIPVVQ